MARSLLPGVKATVLIDIATGIFTATSSMTVPRAYLITQLLPNGKVLVAGEAGGNAYYLNSAELYDAGLVFSDTWRPVISSISFLTGDSTKLTISGSGFKGLSEASGGTYSSSATNYPLLQLQRVDNGQTSFVPSDPLTNWSATSFTSGSLYGMPAGAYRATLIVNAIPSLEHIITIAPVIGVAPVSYDFGYLISGNTSPSKSFTITNNGPADLVISDAKVGSGFMITGDGTFGTLPKTLVPAGSCTISAVFAPGAIASYNTNLLIMSNDPVTPTAAIPLSGVGTGPTVAVTVQTVPTGLGFIVDGTSYVTTLAANWEVGSSHNLAAPSQKGAPGTRFSFANWSDSGAQTHSVNAPGIATTYTAQFITEFQLYTSVSPVGSGTISPTTGEWFATGKPVTLSATAGSNYSFGRWGDGCSSCIGTNCQITMYSATTCTATFILKGDVNGDNFINVFDALMALQYAVGLYHPTEETAFKLSADVAPLDATGKPKGDGVVNVFDALAILRHAVGLDPW